MRRIGYGAGSLDGLCVYVLDDGEPLKTFYFRLGTLTRGGIEPGTWAYEALAQGRDAEVARRFRDHNRLPLFDSWEAARDHFLSLLNQAA